MKILPAGIKRQVQPRYLNILSRACICALEKFALARGSLFYVTVFFENRPPCDPQDLRITNSTGSTICFARFV